MLIDVDLDVLNFILNPNYDDIKRQLEYIKKAYIAEYGIQNRRKIEKNFGKINYLFLSEKKDMKKFIADFEETMVVQLYKKLLSSFGYQYPIYIDEKKNLNFIEKIFVNHNVLFFENDRDLVFFKGPIKSQLISFIEDCHDKERKTFLKEQLNFIKTVERKHNAIQKLLQEKKQEIRKSDQQEQHEHDSIVKSFIINHPIFLTASEFNYINQYPDYDIASFLQKSKYYKHLVSVSDEGINMGDIKYFKPDYDEDVYALFARKNILVDFGIDSTKLNVDIQDGASLLEKIRFPRNASMSEFFKGRQALDILEDEINSYNDKYQSVEYNYRYIIGKEEFINQYLLSDAVANRTCNKDIKDLLTFTSLDKQKREGIYKFVNNSFQNTSCTGVCATYLLDMDKHHNYIGIEYMALNVLSCIRVNPNHKLNSTMDYVLSHEGGHIATMSDEYSAISGFDLEKKYTNLNELYNQYKNKKVRERLAGYSDSVLIADSTAVENIDLSVHSTNYFLLEPFIPKYESVFEEASVNNNPGVLKESLGDENLEQFLLVVNDFYHQQEEMLKLGKYIFIENFDYVQDVKQQVQNIVEQVELRHSSTSNKKK